MTASSLGYVVVESTSLAAWRQFGIDTLGLAAREDAPAGSLHLRVDERPFRIAVVPGRGDRFLAAGWEFRDRRAFESCLASLRAADVHVDIGRPEDAAARCVTELARCADPAGNTLELYWGRALDYKPFA